MSDPRTLAMDESRGSSTLAVRSSSPVTGRRPEDVGGLALVDEKVEQRLAVTARSLLDDLLDVPLHGPELRTRLTGLIRLGDAPMHEVGDSVARVLRRPTGALSGGEDPVARTGAVLAEVRQLVVERDLARHVPAPPAGVEQLDALTRDLLRGQDALRHDNAALQTERDALWQSLGRLADTAVLVRLLGDGLERRVAALRAQGRSDDATTLESDALLAVRRNHQDLLTQLAVGVQGYLALDVVRRTNVELVESVDRALDTVAALRVAAMVDLGRS